MSGPGVARMKRAVRAAIALCGGIDGAAATADRQRSVAGDWNNLNHHAHPPLDCALALDEAAVAQGRRPEIVAALARELGGVFLPLPQAGEASSGIALRVVELAKELGDVSARVSEALADGEVSAREAATIEPEVNDVIDKAVQLRAELCAMQGRHVVPIGREREA